MALLIGSVFPAGVLILELVTGMCAGTFFDPLPTWGHVVLVAAVPVINFLLWRAAQRENAPAPILMVLGGVAIAIGAGYALVFLPLLPVALVGILFMGLGLLPFAPVGALWQSVRLTAELSAWVQRAGRKIALGVTLGLTALIAFDVPATATYLAIGWWQGDAASARRAVTTMRTVGDPDILLRLSYGDDGRATGLFSFLATGWESGFFRPERISPTAARELYYRVTGTPFNAVARADAGRGARRWQFDWDEDQGGAAVGGRVHGLALTQSRIDGSVSGEDNLAYLEWTAVVANAGAQQGEARLTLALPEGAVASRATLWVNGEPREASIGGRGEVRAAYESVVRRQRDPLLVTTDGANRLLVQAFPIEAGSSIQFRVGITAPLRIARDGTRSLALPMIADRNFDIAREQPHHVWIESDTGISGPAGLAATRANGKVGVRGTIPDATYASLHPQLGVAPILAATNRSAVVPRQGEQPALTVIQRILREDAARPAALAIVVDGSKGNEAVAGALVKALDALPAGLPVSLRIAAETPVVVALAPWSSEQRARVERALADARFVGGQDNVPAVADAAGDAARSDAVLLWVHGAQPVVSAGSHAQLHQMLDRSAMLPRLVRYQAQPGPALSGSGQPWFETARFVAPGASPATDLPLLLRDLTQAGPVWRIERSTAPVQGADRGSIHIARLWAAGGAVGALRGKPADRTAAITLARRLNVVTPVSGAVVLATDREYKENGLVAPGADEVPTIPEPHEWALLAIVAGMLLWLWRRRRRDAPATASGLAFA
ncbi:hypothetical protein TS85_05010 [Sphingomonas hengshuiensis]|uniref:VIT domain-containing protein n=1 Tax=Sphingomonas hengshuiensis TaxID=1609977 RepID=A0A7U4J6S4_9SPHN|nr:hypothetical protein TS85_05010 [Sphingomonas hengshuiensis]